MRKHMNAWGHRAVVTVAVFAVSVALLAPAPTAAHAAARKKKGKKAAAAVIAIDLSELGLEDNPALTIDLPETLWRAHLLRMEKYPKRNQLTEAKAKDKRVASRWLQSEVADGRSVHAEIFIVAEVREGRSLREWARRIANKSANVFPFEDARFDGPWIINEKTMKVAGNKRLRGYMLENSGGRKGMKNRYLWQFALLPFPDGYQVLIGVKRVVPTKGAAGKRGGGSTPGGAGGMGAAPSVSGDSDVPSGAGEPDGDSDNAGAEPETVDGAMGDGVGESDGLGDSTTEATGNQIRASTELFQEVLSGIHVKVSKKLKRGLRRFRLRDEWNGANGEAASRYVSIDAPATWCTTPTSKLESRDRIEWTEHNKDGTVAAVYRVKFISEVLTGDIAPHVKRRLLDWSIRDGITETVTTRDGTSQATLCASEITSNDGLRKDDDSDWIREVGFIMASDTLYVIEALRPADAKSRLGVLRDILESVEIQVAQ